MFWKLLLLEAGLKPELLLFSYWKYRSNLGVNLTSYPFELFKTKLLADESFPLF